MRVFPFLRAELAELRADLVGMIGGVEGSLRGELADLGSGVRGEVSALRGEMHSMETRVLVRIGAAMAAQTTLLVAAVSLLR